MARCPPGIALFPRVSEAKSLGPTARLVTGRVGYLIAGFEVHAGLEVRLLVLRYMLDLRYGCWS